MPHHYLSVPLHVEVVSYPLCATSLSFSAITRGGSQLSFMCHIIYLSVPLQVEVVSYPLCATSFICQCHNMWSKSAILYMPHHLYVSAITDGGIKLSFMCHIIYLSVPLQVEVVSYPIFAISFTCQCHYRWR